MKVIYLLIITLFSAQVFGQTGSKKSVKKYKYQKSVGSSIGSSALPAAQPAQPRVSITEKYLRGDSNEAYARAARRADTASKPIPFVSGIRAADNAAIKTFDSAGDVPATNATVASSQNVVPGDTSVNSLTAGNSGVPTNSGAVDKSGQAQFGQSNWGDSRSTVGEGQWTVPPPVSGTFTKEFPNVQSVSWARSVKDTAIYLAKYQMGNSWMVTTYNTFGQLIDSRTEMPIRQTPHPVSTYLLRKPVGFQIESIYKIQVEGKPDVYEIRTKTGETVYVNNDGIEVNY